MGERERWIEASLTATRLSCTGQMNLNMGMPGGTMMMPPGVAGAPGGMYM